MTDTNFEYFKDDVVLYYRCSGTGKPTQAHIMNDKTDKSYCGFNSPTAEVFDNDGYTHINIDVCKKCLRSHLKLTTNK